MHTQLIKIGNSQGIRLPKVIIQQLGLTRELDLEIRDNELVIKNASTARNNWAQAAAQCHAEGEDLLDDWDATAADFPAEF